MDASHFLGRTLHSAHAIEPCRPQSAAELAADKAVHMLGIGAAIPAAILLVSFSAQSGDGLKLTAILLYIAGLGAMLGCSAAYNLVREHWCRPALRRCDHAAIFAMIAVYNGYVGDGTSTSSPSSTSALSARSIPSDVPVVISTRSGETGTPRAA